MIETNLILIDGIAGTGKTTLARKLHQAINEEHGNAILYLEFTKPHPIHEWEVADYQTWRRRTIDNWRTLAHRLVRAESVGILEASVFQGTIGDLLERNIEESEILEFAEQVPSLLKAASPVLIYLVPDDIREHIERTYAERPGRWQAKIDNFVQKTAFGRARRLSSLAGYVAFVEALKKLSDHLFEAYEMKKLLVNMTRLTRAECDSRITDYLALPGE